MSESTQPRRVTLTGFFEQLRGVIGRYPEPDEEYVFEFGAIADRDVHMIGVRRPLQVEWWRDGSRVRVEILRPWIGYASEPADRVIERRPEVAR